MNKILLLDALACMHACGDIFSNFQTQMTLRKQLLLLTRWFDCKTDYSFGLLRLSALRVSSTIFKVSRLKIVGGVRFHLPAL